MLRPKEMDRILVVGPKGHMEDAIEILHSLEVIHIMDFQEPDDNFSLGSPTSKANEISENLVKLRSISNTLQIEEEIAESKEDLAKEDITNKILTLELNINEEAESKKEVEEVLTETKTHIEILKPFALLGLPFDYYHDYNSLAVFVGVTGKALEDISQITEEFEIVKKDITIALFVNNKFRNEMESYLTEKNFSPLDIPEKSGDPGARLKELESHRDSLEKKLEEVEGRLSKLREKHAEFILEAEQYLSVEIEKAEAPLLFATTEHSFVVDGWVPTEKFDLISNKLGEVGDLHIENIRDGGEEDAPILLDNPRASRPFEFLIHLFSTPSYKEFDPTFIVSLIFPVFFGFMIGDFGYGVMMMGLGYLMWKKLESIPALQEIGQILIMGGIFALLFGLLVFGEAFAIPFHAATGHSEIPTVHGAESWSIILGLDIPFHASIHKLENIVDLLLISIIGALVHLGAGYILGFFNEIKHDKKHAVAKIGWLLILFGLFIQLMLMGQHNRVGGFFINGMFSFLPMTGIVLGGITISYVSIGLIAVGTIMFLPAEGPLAVVEIIGLVANMLSYTRLAGIAVAKGAVAVAFNVMLLPMLFSGNVLFIILGIVFLFMAHAMVLILGALASGIQTLRLNYVEFFLKFYEGNGIPFKPFGGKKEVIT